MPKLHNIKKLFGNSSKNYKSVSTLYIEKYYVSETLEMTTKYIAYAPII